MKLWDKLPSSSDFPKSANYGLRRQLILNIGLVMLIASIFLSSIAVQTARIKFERDRERYLNTIAEQFDVMLYQELLLERIRLSTPANPPNIFKKMLLFREGEFWPISAAFWDVRGKVRVFWGRVPSDFSLKMRLFSEKIGGREVIWKYHFGDKRVLWERYLVVRGQG